MISACYLTALGALFWLLVQRSVDRCEAKGESRVFCHLARNSEEFIAHFTLIAALVALASILLLISVGSGIAPVGSLRAVEAFLVGVQHWLEVFGLSVWSTAVILIGVYLLHLIRLPEDTEIQRLPRLLELIRKPARGPRMRWMLHTSLYFVVLITAAAVFFGSQTGSLTRIVSARLAEVSVSKSQTEAKKQTEPEPAHEDTIAVVTQVVVDGPIDQPSGQTGPMSKSLSGNRQERQRIRHEDQAGHRRRQNLNSLADFRANAMDRFKGIELPITEQSDASKPDQVARSESPRAEYAVSQRPGTYYRQPNYYGGRPGYRGATGQSWQPWYPGRRAPDPEPRVAPGPIEKKNLAAERLIDAVYSDLESINDTEKQQRAIAAANRLFREKPSNELEFVARVKEFASEHLPTGGASALITSGSHARSPLADSRRTTPATIPTRGTRQNLPAYPWHVPPAYQPSVRPRR